MLFCRGITGRWALSAPIRDKVQPAAIPDAVTSVSGDHRALPVAGVRDAIEVAAAGNLSLLASAARWRSLVVPPPPPAAEPEVEAETNGAGPPEPATEPEPPRRRSGWRPWVELLKRSFNIDLRCPSCTGVMKLKSWLTNPKRLRRLLVKLGEPAEMQGKAPARAPPYFASKVVRRHFGQPDPQLAMVH